MSSVITVTSAAGKEYSYPRDRYSDTARKDGRRATGPKKGWQIAEMWDNHHEIARLIVLGMNNQQIAEKLSCNPQTVSNVRNSPVVKDKIALLQAARDCDCVELSAEIAEMGPIALKRIREALETGQVLGKEVNAATLLKEANNVIDRVEGKAVQRIESKNLNATLTLEDIESIKQRAEQLKNRS